MDTIQKAAPSQGVDQRANLWELINDIRFTMLCTRTGDGLRSHPMTTQPMKNDDGLLYFFMSRQSDAFKDLSADPSVNLSYAHPGKDRYVSVSGTARDIRDRSLIESLWSPMVQAWFPGGMDDPDVALVGVEVAHAHYWDVEDSKATQLFKMAKAAFTGRQPDKMGDSVEVRIH